INPHDTSKTPGNVFAFKIVEYLASGAHVITTPMGALEKELEQGITYMPDNSAETIAATLRRVIGENLYQRTAAQQVLSVYGLAAIAKSLESFIHKSIAEFGKRHIQCTSCGCEKHSPSLAAQKPLSEGGSST